MAVLSVINTMILGGKSPSAPMVLPDQVGE